MATTAQDRSPLSTPPFSPVDNGTQPAVQFPFQPGSPSTFVGGRNPSLSPNSTSDSETTRSRTVSNASTGTHLFRADPNSTDAPFNATLLDLLDDLQQQLNDARQREVDARQREVDARQREADARQREADARQREVDAWQREADAWRREGYLWEMLKKAQTDLQVAQDKLKASEGAR
ncbi:hypothetical protein BDW22DRAFT_1353830 [Trametopsis cervina]|nr:hypothetical protein BDW22DRAFT_1353830 [Trametopsis cervina]